jgi:hypothetical protein
VAINRPRAARTMLESERAPLFKFSVDYAHLAGERENSVPYLIACVRATRGSGRATRGLCIACVTRCASSCGTKTKYHQLPQLSDYMQARLEASVKADMADVKGLKKMCGSQFAKRSIKTNPINCCSGEPPLSQDITVGVASCGGGIEGCLRFLRGSFVGSFVSSVEQSCAISS